MLILLTQSLIAAEPEENTIPIIGMRASNNAYFSGVGLRLLCELSWKHFDGVEVGGPVVDGSAGNLDWKDNRDFIELCDDAGMLLVLGPWEISQFHNFWDDSTAYWFRWEDHSLASGKCFGQLSETLGAPIDSMTAQQMADTTDIRSVAYANNRLAATLNQPAYSALWFYNVYDEAPARQRSAMINDSTTWDDWIPNLYTQDMSGGEPTLTEIEPAGIYSWQKHLAENNGIRDVPFTINFSLLHTIQEEEYTGLTEDLNYGTMHQQANSVRALCEALYQGPPGTGDPVSNSPEFICFDYYPFRYVHIDSLGATLCDDDWLFLVDHYEEGMDSTVFAARESSTPVFFYPQAFGASGGPLLRDSGGDLEYLSYTYRTPAPQEFRMLCNLALLHQAKGLFPYSLASYVENPGDPDADNNFISSALLDLHGIPFDAPYEDWVYTGRWPDTGDWEGEYEYADPRFLPPFSAGFDPLYEVSAAPGPVQDDPKNTERFLTWFFEPYSRLYREVGDILGEVAVIAPEMSGLWWWEGEQDRPAIEPVLSQTLPIHFVSPRIKMLQHSGNSHAYLFYVNRFLRGESFRYSISVSDSGFQGYLSTAALDHGRRCLVPVTANNGVYALLDTLGPGEARLLEFVNPSSAFQADIRVASPDVFLRLGSAERTGQLHCFAEETVELGAVFYNMGTSPTGDVRVTFVNVSNALSPDTLGSDAFRLSGLSGWFSPDSASASIQWETDVNDIGVHRIRISAGAVSGENTSDNSVTVTVLVEPLDYATEVLGNAWDMTEAVSNPPDWFTSDIVSVSAGWIDSCWTDSVSGMFEGAIESRTYGAWTGFKGDISLNTGGGSINADQYTMLSLAGVSLNPNVSTAEYGCGMFLLWKDSTETERQLELHGVNGFDQWLGNGREMWREFGPLDLHGVPWWGGEISDLRIRFQMDPPGSLPGSSLGIRIGWVRLEEGAL